MQTIEKEKDTDTLLSTVMCNNEDKAYIGNAFSNMVKYCVNKEYIIKKLRDRLLSHLFRVRRGLGEQINIQQFESRTIQRRRGNCKNACNQTIAIQTDNNCGL